MSAAYFITNIDTEKFHHRNKLCFSSNQSDFNLYSVVDMSSVHYFSGEC